MPTPTTWSPISSTDILGEAYDPLLAPNHWAGNLVRFSFATLTSSWSTDVDTGYGPTVDDPDTPEGPAEPFVPGFDVLNAAEKDAVRLALTTWSRYADLKFLEVKEDLNEVGDLRFAFTKGDEVDMEGAQAWAYFPNETATAGDVWFDANGTSATEPWHRGSYEYMTVLHEIGHAIGLKHPFEGVTGNPSTLVSGLDSRSFTVMSYSADPGRSSTTFSYEPTTPMVLDIMALRSMYGDNMTYNSTDTTYTFSVNKNYHQTIWDSGGIDTIVYDGNQPNTIINLRMGYEEGSNMGNKIQVLNSSGDKIDIVNRNIWIAFGSVIENARGGTSSDIIYGNSVNNSLVGMEGNDRIYGSGGNDLLNGGSGSDLLVGGDGADRFRLNSTSGFDTVTDFGVSTNDVIQFDNSVFTKLSYTGELRTANFRASTSGNAADTNDFILYETDTGKLFYDADGSGAGAKKQIALIDNEAALSFSDFNIF